MRKLCAVIGLCLCFTVLGAQTPCDSIGSLLRQWDARLDKLNYEDPEIITLHYYFLQDIRVEIDHFRHNTLPHLARCLQTDYHQTKSAFNRVEYKANRAQELLTLRKSMVDRIFYWRACEALAFQDTADALYNLDRALQFNRRNPDAMLMKARLCLRQGHYRESVELIHQLYNNTELNEAQEHDVSDFTLQLYDHLYTLGTTLIQTGQAADALEVFLTLEQFCSNMPSGYCNDDYYRGILLSREGVYESYLSIARESEKRGNHEMAKKFYKYAEEYRRRSGEAE